MYGQRREGGTSPFIWTVKKTVTDRQALLPGASTEQTACAQPWLLPVLLAFRARSTDSLNEHEHGLLCPEAALGSANRA